VPAWSFHGFGKIAGPSSCPLYLENNELIRPFSAFSVVAPEKEGVRHEAGGLPQAFLPSVKKGHRQPKNPLRRQTYGLTGEPSH
jgi:hypothetical protein